MPVTHTEPQDASRPSEGLAELISRVEYCLDPSTSAKERLGRRAHLTGHDLRTILTALRTQEARPEAVEALEQAAKWFEEYAEAHEAKARVATTSDEEDVRCAKAARNNERSAYLRKTLAALSEQPRKHILFKGFDPEAPEAIRDRNGEVCLACCKVCGLAEIQLDETPVCPGPAAEQPRTDAAGMRELLTAASARLRAIIPTNVSLANVNWPDETNVPLDASLGELRAIEEDANRIDNHLSRTPDREPFDRNAVLEAATKIIAGIECPKATAGPATWMHWEAAQKKAHAVLALSTKDGEQGVAK